MAVLNKLLSAVNNHNSSELSGYIVRVHVSHNARDVTNHVVQYMSSALPLTRYVRGLDKPHTAIKGVLHTSSTKHNSITEIACRLIYNFKTRYYKMFSYEEVTDNPHCPHWSTSVFVGTPNDANFISATSLQIFNLINKYQLHLKETHLLPRTN